MINEKKINELVKEELEDAISKHGKTFNSIHEKYAVLKEEVEEAQECMRKINTWMNFLWNFVKDDKDTTNILDRLRFNSIKLIQETIQVLAMVDKEIAKKESDNYKCKYAMPVIDNETKDHYRICTLKNEKCKYEK